MYARLVQIAFTDVINEGLILNKLTTEHFWKKKRLTDLVNVPHYVTISLTLLIDLFYKNNQKSHTSLITFE